MTKARGKHIYDQTYLEIGEFIGRDFYNALGKAGMEELLNLAPIPKQSDVLDIGSGNGKVSLWLAQRYQAKVCGIEASTPMYQHSLRERERHQLQRQVSLINSPFFAVNFQQNVFQLITAFDSLCYIEDKEKLFTKIMQLLAPGGNLVFSDYYSDRVKAKKYQQFRKQWDLAPQISFAEYGQILKKLGYQIKHLERRTELYIGEWARMKNIVQQREAAFLQKFSKKIMNSYLKTAEMNIQAATKDKIIGYFTCVACKK